MKKIIREPLLHFLLLGIAIFTGYSVVANPLSDESGRIVITQAQIASMLETFALTWQRPPTADEVRGLVRERVREEVYYREAIALGLDKDDTIIRRRLRQKMEFVADDVVAQAQPTDDELGAYLTAHPDSFRLPQSFTFSQVFLNPERHGEHVARDAAQLLSQLNQGGGTSDISVPGDAFTLDHRFDALPAGEVAKLFGANFASTLDGISPGQWQGPVESAYGVHLVFVRERSEGRVPALGEIRDVVHREWANARRRETSEKLYEAMLKRYTVTIERPGSGEAPKKIAATK